MTSTEFDTRIWYKGGFKYQLSQPARIPVHYPIAKGVSNDWASLISEDGLSSMYVNEGYAWDGPSGPTFDTKTFMRGSLLHDVCYQFVRDGLLSPVWRGYADLELRRICLEDGMSRFRAGYVYLGVKHFAHRSARADGRRHEMSAP